MEPELFKLLLHKQHMAYLLINRQCEVLQSYGNFFEFALDEQFTADSVDMFDFIPELIGCDDILWDILEGNLADFELKNLNRINKEGQIFYLNIYILPFQPSKGDKLLLILLSDTTEWTKIQQTLTQQRNELHLLQHDLAQSNQQLEFILQHYVPREVSKGLLEKRITSELGGELREVTVLFADLRNFTSTSEKFSPRQIVEMLHVYLNLASEAIEEAGGVIVNYMGDAVMAVFNAPNYQSDHALRAVRAGLIMQLKASKYHATQTQDIPAMFFGVGINTGQVVMGNIGAQWHYQYTAIGDSVNVASRICSYARAGEILIGTNTYKAANHDILAKPLEQPLKFKGKSYETVVYRVTGLI
jgi:adenylate cyclase